jgi:hypothetical protein
MIAPTASSALDTATKNKPSETFRFFSMINAGSLCAVSYPNTARHSATTLSKCRWSNGMILCSSISILYRMRSDMKTHARAFRVDIGQRAIRVIGGHFAFRKNDVGLPVSIPNLDMFGPEYQVAASVDSEDRQQRNGGDHDSFFSGCRGRNKSEHRRFKSEQVRRFKSGFL